MAKLFSIYVTNEVTTICEVSKRGDSISLYRTFYMDTPKGCVEDGIIIDAQELAAAIRQVLPEKGYQRHKLLFTVSSRRIANKEIVLPYVKNKKTITEIITANVQDYFPMSNIKDYVYEYTVLEIFEEEGRKQYRLSAVAVQKELLESYKELAAELKLGIAAVDYYGNAVFQLMKHQVDGSNTLVLQMEKDVTHVSIMAGKAQVFRRTIPFGEHAIVQAAAEVKQTGEREAEKLLYQENPELTLTGEEYREVVRDIVSSVIRVVDFHVSRNPEMVIENARLFGEGGWIDGFARVMEKELNIPVVVPERLEGVTVKLPEDAPEADITRYLPNLGAALKPLDLKLEEEKKQGISRGRVYTIVLAGTALLSLTFTSLTLVRYFDLREQKETLLTEIAEIQDIEQLYEEYNVSLADLAGMQEYYAGTESRNESMYSLLLDLEQVMPESVGIATLDSKDGDVSIEGISAGKESLAAFVEELKKLSYVTEVWVQDVTDFYDETGAAASKFNMTFKLQKMEKGEETDEID